MYDATRLREGITKIEENIKVFEKAIADERAKIEEYRGMITVIEKKAMEEEINKRLKEG